ncbi:MAG: methylated-DNA--[protein]-cysteine S-methyltransferase [Pseudomonadota bacterium]
MADTSHRDQAGIQSPVGPLCLTAEDGMLTGISWGTGPALAAASPAVLHEAASQLADYFAGVLTVFDLPLRLGPGEFQAVFQNVLINIPLGDTRTYGDLAQELGVSAQAIGQACGANRLPIIVPCHRVLGAQGLGGFSGAGGVESKVALLRHEGAAGLLI